VRREQQGRLQSALEELQKWQARKSGEKAKETRVSSSDPQARAMHQPDGGLALSYNAQISTRLHPFNETDSLGTLAAFEFFLPCPW